jgi:YD repeat-containing protein
MNMKNRLNAIFAHQGPAPRWRYIPRHNGQTQFGWNAWDRKLGRFLTDAEVREIPEAELEEEFAS